jgi:hypothetical protein
VVWVGFFVTFGNVVAAAVGSDHALALRRDHTVVGWGSDRGTTYGNPYTGKATVPAGLCNVVAISAGDDLSLAIRADLQITSLEITGQGPVIHFLALTGQNYAVEYSSDLASGSWSPVPGGAVSGADQEVAVTDSGAGADTSARFYRVRSLP